MKPWLLIGVCIGVTGCAARGDAVCDRSRSFAVSETQDDGTQIVTGDVQDCLWVQPKTGCTTKLFQKSGLFGVPVWRRRYGPWVCPTGKVPQDTKLEKMNILFDARPEAWDSIRMIEWRATAPAEPEDASPADWKRSKPVEEKTPKSGP